MDHIYITPKTCEPCKEDRESAEESYRRCMICDGGLSQCSVCGQAENELESTCPGPKERDGQ